MVKKSTLVLLILFAASVAVLIYLQRTPAAEFGTEPTPTLPTYLLSGWTSDRLSSIELISGEGVDILLTKNPDQTWSQKGAADPVDQGKIYEFVSDLSSIQVGTSLDVTTPLESIGLADTSNLIVLKDSTGASLNFRIGSLAPTGNNYYIQIDTSTPVACNRNSVDALLGFFAQGAFLQIAPTPDVLQLTPSGP